MGRPPATKSTPRPSAEASESICAVIARIPKGRVATYGQVAALAGLPGRARQVGAVLRDLPEGRKVPWQRVINAGGKVSPRGGPGWEEGYQRHLLQEEGVVFSASGRVDLARFGWDPDTKPRQRRSSAARPRRETPARRKP